MKFIPKTVPHGFTLRLFGQTASHWREARPMGARLMTDLGEVPSDLTYDFIKIGKGIWQKRAWTMHMNGAAKADMDP